MEIVETLVLLAGGAALPTVVAAIVTIWKARHGTAREAAAPGEDRLARIERLDPDALEAFGEEAEAVARALRGRPAADG